jgi:nucleoside-triphosphatase THEP1
MSNTQNSKLVLTPESYAGDKPILIGIAGRSGAGKSTLASMLASKLKTAGYDTEVRGFADPIKAMLQVVGIEKGNPAFRQAAQTLGTEWGRHGMHADFWTDYFVQRFEASSADIIVMDDVRFNNEAALCRAHGSLIHMLRLDQQALLASSHESEKPLPIGSNDYIVSNDKMSALVAEADSVVKRLTKYLSYEAKFAINETAIDSAFDRANLGLMLSGLTYNDKLSYIRDALIAMTTATTEGNTVSINIARALRHMGVINSMNVITLYGLKTLAYIMFVQEVPEEQEEELIETGTTQSPEVPPLP